MGIKIRNKENENKNENNNGNQNKAKINNRGLRGVRCVRGVVVPQLRRGGGGPAGKG